MIQNSGSLVYQEPSSQPGGPSKSVETSDGSEERSTPTVVAGVYYDACEGQARLSLEGDTLVAMLNNN